MVIHRPASIETTTKCLTIDIFDCEVAIRTQKSQKKDEGANGAAVKVCFSSRAEIDCCVVLSWREIIEG